MLVRHFGLIPVTGHVDGLQPVGMLRQPPPDDPVVRRLDRQHRHERVGLFC